MENNPTLTQKPGEQIRPIVSIDCVQSLVEEVYGFKVRTVKELNSYDDKNYHIQVTKNINNKYVGRLWPYGYTFKVLNSLESREPKFVEAQNELMKHLNQCGIRCPKPVPNAANIDWTFKSFDSDGQVVNIESELHNKHIIRLLTFIPGKLLVEVEYTQALICQTGGYLATLHNSMKDFNHSALTERCTVWSMKCTSHLKNFLYAVPDLQHKSLVNEVIHAFESQVMPLYPKLPKGIIHGDFNEHNIMVEMLPTTGKFEVTGILDFADAQHTAYIFEVAIAIMYLMLESKIIDPMLVGGYLLAGYTAKHPLQNEEWKILKVCIAARFCVSLVMGLYSHSLDPKNDYLLTSQKRGWQLFQQFWQIADGNLQDTWKKVIEMKMFDPESLE